MKPIIDFHTHRKAQEPGTIDIVHLNPDEIPVDNRFFSCGIHPWQAPKADESVWKSLEDNLKHPQCIAVGETGLDKMKPFQAFYTRQKDIFEKHIRLAHQWQKPVIIHCVRCYDELLPYLKRINVPVIIHGYSKSFDLARTLVRYPRVYLSFGHLILNENTRAFDAFIRLPLDKTVLETDDRSVSIKEIYEKAASAKNIPIEDVIRQMHRNFTTIFKKSLF